MKYAHFLQVKEYLNKVETFKDVKLKLGFINMISKNEIEDYLEFGQSNDPKDFAKESLDKESICNFKY